MHSEGAFLAPMVCILLASRLLGEAAAPRPTGGHRPAHLPGILLGPSLLGSFALRRDTRSSPPIRLRAILQAFAEFGILLLLHADQHGGRRRSVAQDQIAGANVSLAGIAVPFLCGSPSALGAPSLIPRPDRRSPLRSSSVRLVHLLHRDRLAAVVHELILAGRIGRPSSPRRSSTSRSHRSSSPSYSASSGRAASTSAGWPNSRRRGPLSHGQPRH